LAWRTKGRKGKQSTNLVIKITNPVLHPGSPCH
jgi:hypothetical protein